EDARELRGGPTATRSPTGSGHPRRQDTPSRHANPCEPTGSATPATAPEPVDVVTGEAQCPEHEDGPDRAQQVVREVARAEDPDHDTDDRALPESGHTAVDEPLSGWFARGL